MSASSAAPVTTPPPELMGYWYDAVFSDWETRTCFGSTYTYTSSGSYAGCLPLYTGCAFSGGSATESDAGLMTWFVALTQAAKAWSINLTDFSGSSSQDACITQTIYDGASPIASGGRSNIFCTTSGYSYLTLYRDLPASTISSSDSSSSTIVSTSLSSSTTSLSSSTSSLSSSTPTGISSSSSSIPTNADVSQLSDSPRPVSAGAIAGITIGSVALLLLVAFLIWFFGFHKRRNAASGNYGTQGTTAATTSEYVSVSQVPEWVPPRSSIPYVGQAQYPNTR